MYLIKNLTAAFALTIAATLNGLAQQPDNWAWMNPRPQGNSIYAMDFVNDNLGYAAGAYGTFLRTNDGGLHWNKADAGTTGKFLSMFFVDANTGYVGGVNRLLKKTTNGGQTWTTLQLPVEGQFDTLFYILDINFVNHNTGYVLGFFLLENKILIQ